MEIIVLNVRIKFEW